MLKLPELVAGENQVPMSFCPAQSGVPPPGPPLIFKDMESRVI